jgi:hypothetical protein
VKRLKKFVVVALAAVLMLTTAMPAMAATARGGDVTIKKTKCTQKQAAKARQINRGNARAGNKGSAAAISQKLRIKQKQVNACHRGKAAGGNIRIHR